MKKLLEMGVPVSVIVNTGISEELVKIKYTVPKEDLKGIYKKKEKI